MITKSLTRPKKFIKAVPMAMPGLALALAALGNLLPPAFEHWQTIRYICGALALIVLIIFALKLVFDWACVREELKTPLPLSVLPTATMAMMLLATYLRPHLAAVALVVWYTALVAHVAIMLLFAERFVVRMKLVNVFPSWFIAGVGIVTASVTAPAMDAVQIGQIAFWVGFAAYIVLLPPIAIRMTKIRAFPEPARLTAAIITAPASLLVVGYFSSFVSQGSGIDAIVYVLLVFAAVSYIYVSIMMVKLLKIKFYPTYAAFTFPYVISATAFRLGAGFLDARHNLPFLAHIASAAMWIAIAIVIFVLAHYVKYFRFWMKF